MPDAGVVELRGLAVGRHAAVTELRAGDLVLRTPVEEDVPAITAACQDEDIARFLPLIPRPYTEADARTWLAMTQRGWAGEIDEKAFVITRSDTFLGVVSLRPAVGGIGYWLASSARGTGVMTRAVAAIIDWGRAEHGVRRFHLLAHPDNLASQRVAEKLGFRRVGLVAHAPAFSDGTARAVRFELEPPPRDLETPPRELATSPRELATSPRDPGDAAG